MFVERAIKPCDVAVFQPMRVDAREQGMEVSIHLREGVS